MGGETTNQEKPVPVSWRRMKSLEQDEVLGKPAGNLRRRRCIQCCGCCSALMLIIVIVILILIFTVFKVKDTTMTLKSITFDKVQISSPPTLPTFDPTNPSLPQVTTPSVNMTMTADLAVKNPNIASFKFNNATTTLYYNGSQIGEARNPAGNARARRTLNMNITVDLFIISNSSSSGMAQNLWNDIQSGSLTIESYSVIAGRVNVLNIFKRNMTVRMSCNITVKISNSEGLLQDMNCQKHVEF